MPIREYLAARAGTSCAACRNGFEQVEPLGAPALEKCPSCGAPVVRQFSAPRVGASKSGLDQRARSAGFAKYRKLGRGEYEKKY